MNAKSPSPSGMASAGADASGRVELPGSDSGEAKNSSRFRKFRHRPAGVVLFGVAVLLLLSAVLSARAADADSGYDLLGLGRALGVDLARLRWQFAVAVVVLAGLHYGATALATRAASGLRLPFGETVLVQLAASAANRLSPAGIGGAAVNGRYFVKRGLPVTGAVGAVVALNALGALADLIVLAVLVFVGRQLGLSGAPTEITLLTSKLAAVVGPLHAMWTWLALGALVLVALAAFRLSGQRLVGIGHRLWAPITTLYHRPRSFVTLLVASGSTTLILAFAFVLSVPMVPGPPAHVGAGALLVGFMLGSAAGNAVPVPAGIGSTETALVTVLVSSGIPVPHAVEVVLVYRIITFWSPAAIGLLAARRLRRSGAL